MSLPLAMGLGELDNYCARLLSLFILERKSYRFNELTKALKTNKVKMSTPTLIAHLNHLIEKELILREEKHRQYVTYRFNWEKWQDSDLLVKRRILIEKILQKEIDQFSKRPVYEQVTYVNLTATLFLFQILKESIIAKVKPENELVVNINVVHFAKIFERVENMILDNVDKKGTNYATECILTIERLQTLYTEGKQEYEDFQRIDWPTITVTKETNELLQKIHAHVNKGKKPEEHMIEFDVLDNALRCYADKLGVQ